MDRSTVVIISDEPEFSTTATNRWLTERDVPAFTLAESGSCAHLRPGDFDLAVVGGLHDGPLGAVLEAMNAIGKPVIHVSRMNGHSPQSANVITIPEVPRWPDLMIALGNHILARGQTEVELSRLQAENSQLDQQASLGRYMLEVRHNLNNALTSILGNADLILLDQQEISPALRAQIETIRNMSMRMNEIMQRFSSLQKEMQLVEQHVWKKAAKATGF